MTSDRIKEIHERTAYPNSVSVYQALLQVWNECAQEQSKNIQIDKLKFAIDVLESINPCTGFVIKKTEELEQQLKILEDGK